jgi:NADPH-dependent 2,4-dienoyl-CoA reductase/sulfur reductase-like enzyme
MARLRGFVGCPHVLTLPPAERGRVFPFVALASHGPGGSPMLAFVRSPEGGAMRADQIETDYLIIGAGAVGLAFADTLLSETDAHVTIVDRRGKPGGHWNDAYAFVTLHQPSSFYGVNSMPLGSGRRDTVGLNQGLYELASGAEVVGYFDRVMNQRLLPSGRVSYHPLSNVLEDGSFESLLSGRRTQVRVRRKTVDCTYFSPQVPATHTPHFEVGTGVRLVPPNAGVVAVGRAW